MRLQESFYSLGNYKAVTSSHLKNLTPIWMIGIFCSSLALGTIIQKHYGDILSSAQLTPETIQISPADNISPAPDKATNTDSISHSSSIQTTTTTQDGKPTMKVNVNGKQVPVPKNGSQHKVVRDSNGKTSIDISSQSNTDGTSNSMTSLNVQVSSESTSDTSVEIEK